MRKYFWLLLFIVSYWLGSSLVGHKHKGHYLTSDGEGYYMYLPALLIYGSFENLPVQSADEYKPYANTQKIATRFTYGVALMELPFFAIAQLSRTLQGLPTHDGFTNDISVLMLISGCFYLTLGLFFVYKTLLRQFDNKKTVNWTFAILLLGTNLLYYGIREPTMSHVYSFCLVAALIYVLPEFWRDPSVYVGFRMSDFGKSAANFEDARSRISNASTMPKSQIRHLIWIAFLLSLIVLIRPTNVLFAFVVLLFDVSNVADFKSRLNFIAKHIKTFAIIPAIAFLMAIPQLMYWHYLSGKWFLNIYAEIHHQNFHWTEPQFFKVLFHTCNGFLLYTPLMSFALVGIAWMALKKQANGLLIGGIFLLVYYVCSCWELWWFGHSFGYRPFIDYYPLLILGLGFYINALFKSKMQWFKYLNLSVFIGLIFINIRYTILPIYWELYPDGSHLEDFWAAWHWVFDLSKW